MLKMKKCCEICETPLGLADTAYICSFECTFCSTCTTRMHQVCRNCNGPLLLRPPRLRSPQAVAAGLLRERVTGLFKRR